MTDVSIQALSPKQPYCTAWIFGDNTGFEMPEATILQIAYVPTSEQWPWVTESTTLALVIVQVAPGSGEYRRIGLARISAGLAGGWETRNLKIV
jgi:hypothetical protein